MLRVLASFVSDHLDGVSIVLLGRELSVRCILYYRYTGYRVETDRDYSE